MIEYQIEELAGVIISRHDEKAMIIIAYFTVVLKIALLYTLTSHNYKIQDNANTHANNGCIEPEHAAEKLTSHI